MKRYGVIIIGFGKDGKTLIAELVKHDRKAALIERSAMTYKGTYLNITCVPTKRLTHEAERVSWLYPASYEKQVEAYEAVIVRKNEMTAVSRVSMSGRLNSLPNVTIHTGMASLVSRDMAKVTLPDGVIKPQGREIFVNTGSTSIIPVIDGLKDSKRAYTSTLSMELDVLPRHLITVGGGYIGLEFASMYIGFGNRVTVFEGGDKFVTRENRSIANAVKEVLERKGIKIRLNARIQFTHGTMNSVVLTYTDTAGGTSFDIKGDAILVATGREPMIEGLSLQAAGVEVDNHGAIVMNGYLYTTPPNIQTMGDVRDRLQFTHTSLDDYRIIWDDLLGNKERIAGDRNPAAYSVFTDPPLPRVGLTEEEAIRRGYSPRVSRLLAPALSRARTLRQTDGILKAIIDSHSGRIMGCTLLYAGPPGAISTVNITVKTGRHHTFPHDFILIHPNMGEGLNELFSID